LTRHTNCVMTDADSDVNICPYRPTIAYSLLEMTVNKFFAFTVGENVGVMCTELTRDNILMLASVTLLSLHNHHVV